MQPLNEIASARQLFGGSTVARLVLLRSMWPGVVGPEIARRTRVQALAGNQLQVRVTDVRWMKALHRMQARLLGDLRRAAGPLAPRQIGFIEGHPESRLDEEDTNAPRTTSAPPPPAPASVSAAAGAIEDEELRRAFLDAASRYIARFSDQGPL